MTCSGAKFAGPMDLWAILFAEDLGELAGELLEWSGYIYLLGEMRGMAEQLTNSWPLSSSSLFTGIRGP